jgi:purine-binding chemotaxis protein CheW
MVKKEYSPTTVVIILNVTDQQSHRDKMIGIVVDAVSDTYTIKNQDIKPTPDFGQQVNTSFMCGLVDIAGHMMMILDVDTLLSVEA